MSYAIVVYSSVTIANRAKKLALKHMSYAGVMQIPSSLGIKGCNYSLRCKLENLEDIKKMSAEYKLKIKAIFIESIEDGKKVYTRL